MMVSISKVIHQTLPQPPPSTSYCLITITAISSQAESRRTDAPASCHIPSRIMAVQPRSTHFRARFESALQAYQTTTGLVLADHQLAVQVQNCHSVESTTALLKYEARAFNDPQQSDRIMKSIEHTVSILSNLSTIAFVSEASGRVCRNAWRAIRQP